jgi:hypothetical protein
MEPGKAHLGKLAGLRRGIVIEHSGARHLAADETDARAGFQIDGRVEDHAITNPRAVIASGAKQSRAGFARLIEIASSLRSSQ